MSEEVLINATSQETRVALLENDLLQEVRIERQRNKSIVGNVYLGDVVRVLPGMQAAFVDIGLERTALLHARDLATDYETHHNYQQADPHTPITSLLHQSQKITVQTVKNPIGDKGARLSGRISIPSRSLVYRPNSEYTGISRRVGEPAARELLWSIFITVREQVGAGGGFIIRTAAQNASAKEMRADMEFVVRAWRRILQQQNEQPAPALLHRDLPLAVRGLAWQNVDKVRIDCVETWRRVRDFAAELIPGAVARIEHYAEAQPIFDRYAVEDDIDRALQKRVGLQSGGHLVFDQTEAMTTVDINTGSFVGKHNLEETIFKTNLAAALARQLQVRNIGGIVIVDFIDMSLEAHRAEVMRPLERELAHDPTKTQVNEMSALGLVEITRKRTSESLERPLTEPCPACEGRGTQKTVQSTCHEIFREILRQARHCHAAPAAGGPAENTGRWPPARSSTGCWKMNPTASPNCKPNPVAGRSNSMWFTGNFPSNFPARAWLLLGTLLLAGTAGGGDIYERILTRSQWPQHANGHNISALPTVNEALRRFEENGKITIIIHYPGGDPGRQWANELYGWLVSFGIPTRYLELQPGSGAADRLVVSVIDRG